MSLPLRVAVLLTMGFCLLASVGAPRSAEPPSSKKYALLVGVNEYDHAKLPALKYAENDAADMADALTTAGYEVIVLTGAAGKKDAAKAPTHDNIHNALNAVVKKYKKGDTILIGFAGHGLQFAGDKECYFCPQDAKPFKDEAQTLVALSVIYDKLDKALDGTKIMLVDACRNDPDPARGRGIDSDNAPAPPKGVAALFSCSAGQRAYESDSLKHGIFFHYVLEALQGKAGANNRDEVTWGRLTEYVPDKVEEEVRKQLGGDIRQSPNAKADVSGRSPVLVALNPGKGPVTPGKEPARLKAPFDAKDVKDAQAAWAKRLGRKPVEVVDLGGGVTLELVLIPPGTFEMGSPKDEKNRNPWEKEFDAEKQHTVSITKPFYLAKYPVTQEQYEKLMGKNPSYFSKEGDGKDRVKGLDTKQFPVEMVSWDEADACCKAAGKKTNWGKGFLPTEAQWEYACRAGTAMAYYFGDDAKKLDEYAWYGEDYSKGTPHPVGGKKPNAFGLYDMHGNVWQWCADYYGPYDGLKNENPERVDKSSLDARVVRGGSWYYGLVFCRAACRYGYAPGARDVYSGLRVCFRLD